MGGVCRIRFELIAPHLMVQPEQMGPEAQASAEDAAAGEGGQNGDEHDAAGPETSQKQPRGRKAGDKLYRIPDIGTYPDAHRMVAVQANADEDEGGKWYARLHKSAPSSSKCLAWPAWP